MMPSFVHGLRPWRLVTLVVSFALAMVAAEYATRRLLSDVTTTADNRGFFTRRWLRTGAAQLNSAGFRDREFTTDKPAGTFRIAVVGDSFAFGNGIRLEDRFTELLQRRLPPNLEILNFGRSGDNTPEHLDLVQTILPNYRPDFVLLQWYINDVEDSKSTARPRSSPLLPVASWHDWLSLNSGLYSIANMEWAKAQVALGMTGSYAEFLRSTQFDPRSHEARLDQELLNKLITVVQQRGVGIGMVLFPDTSGELGDGYTFAYLHERVLANCEQRGIKCVDLRNDFAAVKDRRQLWANRFDHHPGPRANAIAAERILETFSADWARGR